jgi:hypothetical protein
VWFVSGVVIGEIRKLDQKKLVGKRSFALVDDGVHVKQAEWFSSQDFMVPFEVIGKHQHKKMIYSKGWLGAAILFLILCTVTAASEFSGKGFSVEKGAYILHGGIALFCAVIAALSRRKLIIYGGKDGPLAFYEGKPSKEKLEAFIEELEIRKRSYLLGKYAYNDRTTSKADELAKIAWLKDQGVITEAEFEKLKQDILGDDGGTRPLRDFLSGN